MVAVSSEKSVGGNHLVVPAESSGSSSAASTSSSGQGDPSSSKNWKIYGLLKKVLRKSERQIMRVEAIPTPENWRALPVHPMAQVLPTHVGMRFEDLVRSISQNGYDPNEPILVHEGMIIDGRHRREACVIANVPPRFAKVIASPDELLQLIHYRKDARQHYTPSQRAMMLVDMLVVLAYSQMRCSRLTEVNVSHLLSKKDKVCDCLRFLAKRKKGSKWLSDMMKNLKSSFDDSWLLLGMAKNVLRYGVPELRDLVVRGILSLRWANRVAMLSEPCQKELIDRSVPCTKKQIEQVFEKMKEEGSVSFRPAIRNKSVAEFTIKPVARRKEEKEESHDGSSSDQVVEGVLSSVREYSEHLDLPLLDAAGVEVPSCLRDVFKDRFIERTASDLEQMLTKFKFLGIIEGLSKRSAWLGSPGVDKLAFAIDAVDVGLRTIIDYLNRIKPKYVCSSCNGTGCEKCHRLGYLTEQDHPGLG